MKQVNLLFPALALAIAVVTPWGDQAFQWPGLKSDQEEQTVERPGKCFVEPIAATEQDLVITMDRVFRPLFENLKQEIGLERESPQVDFDNVARDSLMMSEFLARIHQWPDVGPFDSAKARAEYSETQKGLSIREAQSDAAAIYHAADREDFDAAQKAFVSMTNHCNQCHRKRQSRWVPVILKP